MQMSNTTDIQTVTQPEKSEFIKTSMSLPVDVHRAIRIEALNRGVDAQEIWAEAGREYLAKRQPKTSAA